MKKKLISIFTALMMLSPVAVSATQADQTVTGKQLDSVIYQVDDNQVIAVGNDLPIMYNNRLYVPANAEIDVYPLDIAISADVVYMPGFIKLADRDAALPFPSELDNAVIAMTLAQIAGKDVDFMMANAPYGNAVSRFFRGRGISAMCGRGPW